MPRMTSGGTTVPRPVLDALRTRVEAAPFTPDDLRGVALVALREHGGPLALRHHVVERVMQHARRLGLIVRDHPSDHPGTSTWSWAGGEVRR